MTVTFCLRLHESLEIQVLWWDKNNQEDIATFDIKPRAVGPEDHRYLELVINRDRPDGRTIKIEKDNK